MQKLVEFEMSSMVGWHAWCVHDAAGTVWLNSKVVGVLLAEITVQA